jgi:hypothetical protein
VLTAKSALDPQMTTELEDGLKLWFMVILAICFGIPYLYASSHMLMAYLIYIFMLIVR